MAQAQALGNYYTDLILYEESNIAENGELDVLFALLRVSKLFRMEAGSKDIVDIRKG